MLYSAGEVPSNSLHSLEFISEDIKPGERSYSAWIPRSLAARGVEKHVRDSTGEVLADVCRYQEVFYIGVELYENAADTSR